MNAPDWITHRLNDDRGVAGGGDVLLFSFVMIIFSAMIIINAWIAVDTSLAVSAAAREGARTFVESDDVNMARTDAEAAMNQVMVEYGHANPGTAMVPTITIDGGLFVRCAVVTTTASVDVDLITLPFFGALGSHTITATHNERIDPFRSGTFTGGCP